MARRWLHFFWAAMVAAVVVGIGGVPSRAQTPPVHEATLSNGLRVLIYPRGAEPPIAAVQVWVGAGGADEPAEKGGLAHFFEHMLFQGSEGLEPREFSRRIEKVGGRSNAGTGHDFTYYYVTVPSHYVEEAVALLGEVTTRPTFPQEVLEREREVIFREIEFRHDDPGRYTHYLLYGALHDGHPYGRPVLGNRETVASITRDDMLEFIRRHYVPENMALVVVGDVDPERVLAAAEASFGSMEPRPVPPRPNPLVRPLHDVISLWEDRDWEQGRLHLGWHAPAGPDEDVYALEMVRSLLSRGRASRFQRHIQRELGVVTAISAGYVANRDRGTFTVYSQQPPGWENQVEAAVLHEIRRLQQGDFSDAELERARTLLLADIVFGLQSHSAVAFALGYSQIVEGDWRRAFDFEERIRAVDRDDVIRAAQKYLSTTGYVRVYAGPPAPSSPTADRSGLPMRHVLPNGHVLIVQDMPHSPVIAVETVVKTGVLQEPQGKAGLAALTARLLLKGTEKLPEEEFFTRIEELGGRIGGRALSDTAHFTLTSLPHRFPELLRLYAEGLLAPAFSEEIFERERRQLARELQGRADEFFQVAMEGFQETLYGDHPYGRTTAARLAALEDMTLADVEEYYRTYYGPQNMVTVVVGPLAGLEISRLLTEVFGGPGHPSHTGPQPALGTASVSGGEKVIERRTEAGWLVVGFPAAPARESELAVRELLTTIVGRGSHSLLMRELREGGGLTYTTGAGYPLRMGPGYFAVYAVTPPSREAIQQATEGIFRVLEQVASSLDDEEMERARELALGAFVMERETAADQASVLARFEAFGFSPDLVQRYPQLLREVTKEQVQEMARTLFVRERAVRAYVLPGS